MPSNSQKPQQPREPQQRLLPLDGRCNGPLFSPLQIRRLGQSAVRSRTYRKKLKQATPPWADLEKVQDVYKQAKQLTRESGVQYSVDHIIPLRGPLVWGLHVHNNLQILLHAANMKKSNICMDQLEMF